MSAGTSYVQLPRNVWFGVWSILRKTPKRKLDEKALSAELGVQPTAAKAYAKELVKLGILEDDFTPSELANRWRQDGTDQAIIREILDSVYPEELRDLAPIGDVDRDKVIRWFMNEGLGEGAAKNKTATYAMLAEGVDEEFTPTASKPTGKASSTPVPKGVKKASSKAQGAAGHERDIGDKAFKPEMAVNVQIHISADATGDQIDAIFSSMKKYFG